MRGCLGTFSKLYYLPTDPETETVHCSNPFNQPSSDICQQARSTYRFNIIVLFRKTVLNIVNQYLSLCKIVIPTSEPVPLIHLYDMIGSSAVYAQCYTLYYRKILKEKRKNTADVQCYIVVLDLE